MGFTGLPSFLLKLANRLGDGEGTYSRCLEHYCPHHFSVGCSPLRSLVRSSVPPSEKQSNFDAADAAAALALRPSLPGALFTQR